MNTPEVYGKNIKYPSRESLFGLQKFHPMLTELYTDLVSSVSSPRSGKGKF